MSLFRRRDAKFVYVALDGRTHKAHLWPGDTFNINTRDNEHPVLKISYRDKAWYVEQLMPALTLDRDILAWARRQPVEMSA